MSAPKQWIRQAWVIEGTITTEAPMIIGTGKQSEETDILIQRDEEGSPFIPATSLIGCLREYWYSRYSKDNHPQEVNRLWGYSDRAEGMQSGITLWDLSIQAPSNDIVEVRDGIKIDSKTGIAES
ncbi:MAG TPA: RAMP superfamily CRISPR-associated protein, partial [Thermotogota bacterium]|nr:RAMP superfamily CRISPR-associated protein [Thermotogota bacterium]